MTIARKENLNSRLFPCSFLIIAGPIAILLSIAADEGTIPPVDCYFDGKGCFSGFCYEFLSSVGDFSVAIDQCTNIPGYELLSLHSQEESDFIVQLLCSVNATSEVWTAGYTRILDIDNLNGSFSWLVNNDTLSTMDWMAPFEEISTGLYGHPATIVLSNRSANSYNQTWTAVPPGKVDRHALCKRPLNTSDSSCLSVTVFLNGGDANCTTSVNITTTTSEPSTRTPTTPSTTSESSFPASPSSNSDTSSHSDATTMSSEFSDTTSSTEPTTQSSSPSTSPDTSTQPTSEATTQSTSESTSESNATSQSSQDTTSQSTSSPSTVTSTSSPSTVTTSPSTVTSSPSTVTSSPLTVTSTSSPSTVTSTSSPSTVTSSSRSDTTWTTFPETSSTGQWCEATSFGGCDWPATPAGTTAETNCPSNSTGLAKWYCDPETLVFQPEYTPNFSQCVNDWVEAIEQEISNGHKSALELAESMWSNASVTQVFYSKDLSLLQQIMMEIDRKFLNETDLHTDADAMNVSRIYSEYIIYTCDILLDVNQSRAWNQLNEARPEVANQLSFNVESVGFILASALDDQQDNIQRSNLAIFVERRPKATYAEKGFLFEMSDGQWQGIIISLPDGFQENSIGNHTSVITVLYSNMQNYLGDTYTDTSLAAMVITNVIGMSIDRRGQSVHFDEDGIQFKVPHTIPDDTHYHICSFWNSSRLPSGLWDSSGCTLLSQDSQYTTCTCNHLTDFAILLDINGIIETMSPLAQEILNVLTICCGSLSALSLVICLFIFHSIRILRCIRTSVTKNLCICILIEDILVLTMMQETSNKVFCAIIAGTLEYVLLAAFMWMLIEGIHLYRLMILVFETCPRTLQWYYLIGYGVPFCIVAISAGVYPQGYGTSLYCWLDDKLIWGFAVPVAIIILINFAMLILALRTARKVEVRRTQNKLVQFRKYVTGAISLTSILGLTWIFGFFYVNESTVIFSYIFTVLNASQGIFIFIFHCIVNENVRKCILRRLARCRKPKIPWTYHADETRQVLKTPKGAKDGAQRADEGAAVWTLTNSMTLTTTLGPGSTNDQEMSAKLAIPRIAASKRRACK